MVIERWNSSRYKGNGRLSKVEFKKITYFGINMKHLTVEIQVGVNERENWHLGASLESREKELMYGEKQCDGLENQKWIFIKKKILLRNLTHYPRRIFLSKTAYEVFSIIIIHAPVFLTTHVYIE